MTLFNNDRDRNDREKRTPPIIDHAWGGGFSPRSTVILLLTIVAVVIGVWLIFSFLIGVTRIEAATSVWKSTLRAASGERLRFRCERGGFSIAR